MKRSIAAILITLAAGTAAAGNAHDFERQFGSEEYVHSYDAQGMTFAQVTPSNFVPSIEAILLDANVEGIAPNDFHGTIVKSGPTRISLYEVQRGSPEASGYEGYYAKFSADTDWDLVARENRENANVASKVPNSDSRS